MTEETAWAWWLAWCAQEGQEPLSAGVGAPADALLDARNAGWGDRELVVLVEAVGDRTGTWVTSGWATLRLGLHA